MNKNLKRRLYAIALAGVLLTTPKITAYADEVDMTPIDIDSAISELVPGYSDNNNNDNNNNNNDNNNANNNDNNDNNNDNNNANNNNNNNDNNNANNNNNNNDNNNANNNDNNNANNNDKNVNNNANNNDNNANNNNNNNNNDKETKNNSSNSEECKHVYTSAADDVINQKTPSCTESGSYDEVYYCEKCGAKEIRHYEIPAPEHKWDGGTKIVTSNGYEIIYHCTNKGCDATTNKTYENTPTEPTKPTTPTEPGNKNVPKTGDDSHIYECAGVMVASALGIAATTAAYNNQEKQKQKYKGKYLSKRK